MQNISLQTPPRILYTRRIIHGALNPKYKENISGLQVEERWKDFYNFYQDVGNPPAKNMAFDRLDKSKGFFPNNCKWLTKSQASIINAISMKKKVFYLVDLEKKRQQRILSNWA